MASAFYLSVYILSVLFICIYFIHLNERYSVIKKKKKNPWQYAYKKLY